MSRVNYKVPRWVKKKIENELYQYWDNKKELEEMQRDIIESSPEPPDGQPRGNNTSNTTEQKAIKLRTSRSILAVERRLKYIENAIARLNEKGLLYISVLTDPTTGGVTASFASLGDIILAEPKALIGFAGPRVIEQTINQKLPEGFQSSEFLLEHGFIDKIVERKDMKHTLAELIRFHK